MACNPCCCFNIKDSAVMIGIWTLVYSIASLFLFGWQTGVLNHCRSVTMSQANLQCEWDCPCVGSSTARTTRIIEGIFSITQLSIMGWQMAAIKYERDRAANTLLPNYNTYGKYDIPSYYESYWQSPEERYYTGLFVIQILCLIAAFFLLFASVALIYGVHTWSRHLIWPWFICIISSILSSLAYCIMWWAGDVRDYWMALTILEIIGVFINVYCVVVVYMFMQRLAATTDEYEGKKPQVRYKVNRNGYTRKPLDDYHSMNQPYPLRSPSSRMVQTPLPMPSSQYPPVPPYPVDEPVRTYEREPKARVPEREEDPVAHWVKDQQRLALLSERVDANSEPVTPTRKQVQEQYPLQHSRSVPSLYDGTLVSHRSCRHGKHRGSSRRRSKSRHAPNSSDSDSQNESPYDRKKRHRSRTRCSESEFTETTERWDRGEKGRRSKSAQIPSWLEPVTVSGGVNICKRAQPTATTTIETETIGDDEKSTTATISPGSIVEGGTNDRISRQHLARGLALGADVTSWKMVSTQDWSGRRKSEYLSSRGKCEDLAAHRTSFDTNVPGDGVFPLSGGISIPQHIVIPPSMGERGPDGNPLPQKFQINSEITINYDGLNSSPQSDPNDPYRRRYPAVSVQSNV
ncbi:unnamed protein product [Heligmosomoides polygyrus]|uniref:MARVEL domain-containing protein n=1 Tax=Heligmosomoides polygyrus TaxID=6339 RepID=A0A183G8X6_HELPZ|nr:unnamed protein product [Heligmosomoides polygyrus]